MNSDARGFGLYAHCLLNRLMSKRASRRVARTSPLERGKGSVKTFSNQSADQATITTSYFLPLTNHTILRSTTDYRLPEYRLPTTNTPRKRHHHVLGSYHLRITIPPKTISPLKASSSIVMSTLISCSG